MMVRCIHCDHLHTRCPVCNSSIVHKCDLGDDLRNEKVDRRMRPVLGSFVDGQTVLIERLGQERTAAHAAVPKLRTCRPPSSPFGQ